MEKAEEIAVQEPLAALPEVSVVMSVYNGAGTLAATLQSILDQEGCHFELIVVNDGSSDESDAILDEWAGRDARLRVIHQANTGLTRALIRGCEAARGEFIARQDCGDISLPRRLAAQMRALRSRSDATAVSCDTRFVGPKDEPLYIAEIGEAQLNQGLADVVDGDHRGPSHHGSVMMRRSAYVAAGGYRRQFYFAQDLDLWTRLADKGRFAVVPEVLYAARLDPRSISGTQTQEQQQLAALIAAATVARRAGQSEDAYLNQAATVKPIAQGDKGRREALGNYFIGSCLRQRSPGQAAGYFKQAIELNPWFWRARMRFFQAVWKRGARAA